MTSGGIRLYSENSNNNTINNKSNERTLNKPTQKKNSRISKKNRLPPPPIRHRLIQSSYRTYNSPTTNVLTSTTAVATAAAYAAYNRHNVNNTKSLLNNNNAVNIVAAAATGYGNNISPALKNNNPALKSLSLSSSSSLLKSPSLSPNISPKNSLLKENDFLLLNDTHSTSTGTNTPNSDKENLSNNIKKKNSNSSLTLKHKNNSNSSINSNHSNSKINYALKLLSDADHYQEDDLECISLRKEAVEILKDYKFDKNHVVQLYQMGLNYVYEKDYQKAFDIFKEAHEYHYPPATFQLARYYESGILETIPKDNKIAQKYYRQAALNSYCKAMYRLSMAYLHGEIGCKKSKKESIRWLHRCTWSIEAKEQIVVGEAMYQLSKFYEKGMTNDKEKDQKSAASYLRMAAEKYCVDAQDYLGYCYQHGHLTYPVNLKKALYWFTQAANGHCIESKISLCHLYLTGSLPDIPQDDSEALYWIRRAANSTHANNSTQKFSRAKAQYILGWFFEEGLENILDKDKKEAIKWYLRANFEGVPDAKIALKHFTQEEIEEVEEEERNHRLNSHNSTGYESDGHGHINNSSEVIINHEHEEEYDYSFGEYSDDNSSASDRSSRSLNVKIMNIASSLFSHTHLKGHRHSKSFSNTHDNKKNGEISHQNENKPSSSSSTTITANTTKSVQNDLTDNETLIPSDTNYKISSEKSTDIENSTIENTSFQDKENKMESEEIIIKVSPSENESEEILMKVSSLENGSDQLDSEKLKSRIEEATFRNNRIHMEQLNRKIKKANSKIEIDNISQPNNDSSNSNNNNNNHDLELVKNNDSKKLNEDEFKYSKEILNDHEHEEQHHLYREEDIISEREKQYIAKINSELVKSMMIVKSEPGSPYITPYSYISSNSSQYTDDKEKDPIHPSKYLEQITESICSSCSYCSYLSDECSVNSSSYCCSSCCCNCNMCNQSSKMSNAMSSVNNTNTNNNNINNNCSSCSSNNNKHTNSTLNVKAPDSTISEDYVNSNYDTMSQDSSISSIASCDKQFLNSHLRFTAQKFAAGYDKSQITSSDRMKAYTHYKSVVSNRNNNKNKNFKDSLLMEDNNISSTSTPQKKLIRRHSHSGIPAKISLMTPLKGDTASISSTPSGLKKRSKSSHNIHDQLRISTDDEDALRLHHIKGLSETESEISYVCPQTANIFDNFEKKEEHHDYGYHDERHQNKPKKVVKSCQHAHHQCKHFKHQHHHRSRTHSFSLSYGHKHHHHHKRNHSQNQNHSDHLNNSILKFKIHNSLTALSSIQTKSTDSLDQKSSNHSLNTDETKIENSMNKNENQNRNIISSNESELHPDNKEQSNDINKDLELKEDEIEKENKLEKDDSNITLIQNKSINNIKGNTEREEENKNKNENENEDNDNNNTNEDVNTKNISNKEEKLIETNNKDIYSIENKENISPEICKLNNNNNNNNNIDNVDDNVNNSNNSINNSNNNVNTTEKNTIKGKTMNRRSIIPKKLIKKLSKEFTGSSLKNKRSNESNQSHIKLHQHFSFFNKLNSQNEEKITQENKQHHHFWNNIHVFHHRTHGQNSS